MFSWEDEFGNEHQLREKTAAVDAINAIRRGDTVEAITILEREFLPQWEDVADCEEAYRKVRA
ncbi:hypothetical protein LB523_12225 [Mesorhizobium sp. ESP-6-4]|uniref:hypothetical protein n=1 Tax=Mesorhizobium sp. ESP-6-4 TaxID=2876624 RepID=UPI001CCECB7C|nr:hypothetical protein [Mesorhizobium sp. ESP-6-4]MBZ9659813.1 hypothetical protein [Mesorhizobium sp. ESP-6-4]